MYKKPLIQAIGEQSFADAGIRVDVLRLDAIHPHVSGNKWYKLKYHIEAALAQGKKALASFGGSYSNHLVAMAFACKERALPATGIIRGEEPAIYNPSLAQMKALGMKLRFVSRETYRQKEKLADELSDEHYVIPEGGAGPAGIKGAFQILDGVPGVYTHIVCAVGTGTTIAGIINASAGGQQVIGISSLKVENESDNELLRYIDQNTCNANYTLLFNYHFGGYAKKNEQLLGFMNELFSNEKIPTDFVYTGKLFYAVYDLAGKNYFAAGSRVLVIHSGGLQGNRSLAEGTLKF